MPKLFILMILALGISLSGCGGGGGGSSAAVDPPPTNQAPTANAGADQSADEGATVNLSATGADSDGTIVSYSWQQESGTTVTITNADMANASFVAPMVAASEDLIFQVAVTDDDGATGLDTVTVTVNDLTPPPPPPPPGVNFIPLGDLPGGDFDSNATGVSDDGTVVVGVGSSASGNEAFRWTIASGMVGLGDLPGGLFGSAADDVSGDGSVVVGQSQSSSEAFRWTSAGGLVGLGESSAARDVSADGSVVVGSSQGGAFRWTSGTGIVGLGDLDGNFSSRASAVSADGSVVVGQTFTHSEFIGEPFVWTQDNGMQGLLDVLVANGATGFEDWQRMGVSAISADGQWVVGKGTNPSGFQEAFLADISPQMVTSAQMAMFLERGINGSDFSSPAATGNTFLDVGANDFAAAFIEQFFLDGITSGCGGHDYCPNDAVTRAQMAVFLLRTKHGAGYLPPAPSGVFGDVDLAYWAVGWIDQLAAEGITSGCGGGNYCPDDPVTRAEMAAFLIKMFGQ